jgi:hypothetical protein
MNKKKTLSVNLVSFIVLVPYAFKIYSWYLLPLLSNKPLVFRYERIEVIFNSVSRNKSGA